MQFSAVVNNLIFLYFIKPNHYNIYNLFLDSERSEEASGFTIVFFFF